MRVAVMGAGLSGLACAITLERNGITPDIFEKRRDVGDRFVNGEILFSVLTRPVGDCLAHLSDKYGINLQPVGNIRRLIVYSENERAEVTGHLGFSNLRGRDLDSFENQLARQLKTQITFNSSHTYEELLEDYTHVVMATGDADYTARIQDFQKDLTACLSGATVEGDFDRYTVMAWMDGRLAPQGYGYLIPMSTKEAHIVISYPDYPENHRVDIENRWESFYSRVCSDLDQTLLITDRFQIRRYLIGLCRYPRIGNTFFVGNCFGAIMPFLGFGQYPALLTGIYAGRSVSDRKDYAEMVQPLRESYGYSLALRRIYEQLSNSQLDRLVRILDTGLGSRLFNSRHNLLKIIGFLMSPVARREKRRV